MNYTFVEIFHSDRIPSEKFSTNDERVLKGETVARDFYPFVENGETTPADADAAPSLEVRHPARIAVYDDASAAPRVVVIEPKDVRDYLEEITATVSRLSREQGGTVPFMVIREIVENFIHAYFQAPTITILDNGNTIRFSDQGPGIKEKSLALEYGTSSATEEMKRYIRGVGSGLPYVQQYMADKGGSLEVEDNIAGGTVVTLSTRPANQARAISGVEAPTPAPQPTTQQPSWTPQTTWPAAAAWPSQQPPVQPMFQPQPQPQQGLPITLDDRSSQVLSYLAEHDSCGPTDLVRACGSSAATWSRSLSALAAQGLVMKDGQKYRLTGIGRTFV